MKKEDNKTWIYLLCSFVLAFWAYGVFLYPHFSQDTYAKSLYNQAWSFNDAISSGRYTFWLVSTIIFKLFKTRALNNTFSNALCIIFFAVSIYSTYSLLTHNNKKHRPIAFLLSAAIFINPCFVDYFQFPECNIIFSFGLILVIISAKSLFNDNYGIFRKHIQSALMLIITVGIYQPLINYFVLLGLLLIWNKFVSTFETDKKNAFIELARNLISCISVYLSASILQLIVTSIFHSNQRISRDYIQNITTVIKSQASLWKMQSTGNKTYLYILLFCSATVLLIIQLYKKYSSHLPVPFVVLLTLYAGLYISSFATHIVAEPWLSQRTTSVFYSHIVLILYASYTVLDKELHIGIIGIASILICLFIYRSNNLSIQTIKNNAYDEQIVYNVMEFIDAYESKNQVSVNNIAISRDKYVTWAYPGIHSSYDLNVRAWCYTWAVSGLIHQYTGRLYNVVPMEPEKKSAIFGDADWSRFNYDQLYAEGDTLYMLVY